MKQSNTCCRLACSCRLSTSDASSEEVFPPKKDAEFDDCGRPFHSLFYTGKPNYYQLLHDMTENIVKLNRYEDTMISKNIQPDPNIKIELTGSAWISKEKVELQLVEQISDKMYANLIELLDRVVTHPYSYTIKDEILKYRIPFLSSSLSLFLDPGVVQYDDEGRAFVEIVGLRRKSANGSVTVYKNGTGKILINGKDLLYFERMQSREQVLFPLQFSGLLNEVDVVARVEGGGTSSQAGVVRLGIAMAIKHFVDETMAEQMRIAGLLTPDVRTKERKKFGQMKARRKYTWKKR
ncbi:hypothetical protein LSTR_LSTR010493 [Laodelphax striatellus]|uniref:Small ribosomal subunit protein uS9m n=1 Tax=Laodelphax striatellus TaxID=195883 RepID=A0A482X5U0_LAOST|nr:hypothetical protein LSTR_LSTR010493 [Laodelphax striatellus]